MSSQTNKSDENIFDILENDIAAFSKLGKCMIYGDFNARTGIHPDFCLDDDSPVNYLTPDYVGDTVFPRHNSDQHHIDNHGNQLLSLCKTTGLKILNGRVLGDTFFFFHLSFIQVKNDMSNTVQVLYPNKFYRTNTIFCSKST